MRKLKLLVLLAAAATALAVVPAFASADESVDVCGGSAELPGTWVNHNVGVTFTPCQPTRAPRQHLRMRPGHRLDRGEFGRRRPHDHVTATYADATQATGTAVVQIDRTAPNNPQMTPNHGAAPSGWFTTPLSVAFFFDGGGLSPPTRPVRARWDTAARTTRRRASASRAPTGGQHRRRELRVQVRRHRADGRRRRAAGA